MKIVAASVLIFIAGIVCASGQFICRECAPYSVALLETSSQPSKFFCSGSVISTTFVLSAARCFHRHDSDDFLQPQDVLALFGAFNLSNPDEEGRVALHPKEIKIHEDWKPQNGDFNADLALLEFEKGKITFQGNKTRPIYLWNSADEPQVTQSVVMGWANPQKTTSDQNNLLENTIAEIFANEKCPGTPKLSSSSTTICARTQSFSGRNLLRARPSSSSVCRNAHGTGLLSFAGGVPFLRGILLTTTDESSDDCTATFIDVLKFQTWILINTRTSDHVHCNHKEMNSFNLEIRLFTCVIDQAIDNESSVLGTEYDPEVMIFDFQSNQLLQFLPKDIGKKMPNLMDFRGSGANLTVVRDFYFKNMSRLAYLDLSNNRITLIEAGAFDDLMRTEKLWLNGNRIETLDAKLFAKMLNLREVFLNGNQLKVVDPKTFQITGGSLEKADLTANTCIDKIYDADSLSSLEADLLRQCQQASM